MTRRASTGSLISRKDDIGLQRLPSASSVNSLSSRKSVRFEEDLSRLRESSPLSRWKPNRIGSMILIMCLIGQAVACDKVIPISHNEDVCENNNCKMKTIEDIFTSPLQKEICIVVGAKDRIIAKIHIEIEHSYKRCEKGPIMYTYNTTSEVTCTK